MLKIIKKHFETDLIKISAIFAMVYMVLFNSAVLMYKFNYYQVGGIRAFFELGKDFLYIYLTLFILFFGLAVNRTLFCIASFILFLTGALASYYLYFFQITPTKEIVKVLFNTNLYEAFELASTRLVIWLIFSAVICCYTITHFGVNNTKLFVTKIVSALCLLLAINAVISPPYKVLSSYFPIQYLHNTYLYFTKAWGSQLRSDISRQFNFVNNSQSDVIGVLVIGESARYDHFGINGYERNTTPNLQKIDNLFSFKAQSCSNITYLSVPCMLSRHPTKEIDKTWQETGLISILTKLGFSTSWIGTQSLAKYFYDTDIGTIYDEVNFAIIPGGLALFAMNAHDEVMLPYIENMLHKSGKQFLAIHTSGSHWSYDNRYPKKFGYFQPICSVNGKVDQSSCDHEKLINSYDNSILYTDFFLSSIIELLKDKNAYLIYASDHAESLGENGRYGHGGEISKEQIEIPFIVWVSDKFSKLHPNFLNSLARSQNSYISHDHLFHSILGCLDIHSEIINPKLSLCRVEDE